MLVEDPSVFSLICIPKFFCNFNYFIWKINKNTNYCCDNTNCYWHYPFEFNANRYLNPWVDFPDTLFNITTYCTSLDICFWLTYLLLTYTHYFHLMALYKFMSWLLTGLSWHLFYLTYLLLTQAWLFHCTWLLTPTWCAYFTLIVLTVFLLNCEISKLKISKLSQIRIFYLFLMRIWIQVQVRFGRFMNQTKASLKACGC